MNWAMVILKVNLLLCSLMFWKACECAPLESTIAGSTSCVGDNVTYTCTIPSFAHLWTSTSLGIMNQGLAGSSLPFSGSDFTIAVTSDEGGTLTTQLNVTASAALNETTIICTDGNEVQNTTAMVFGPPSAPGLTVVADGDLASYDFTITPSSPPECVLDYIITATSSDGSRTITVPASGVDGSTPVNQGGFDVCTVMYSFTVAPVTSEGTGNSSASVDRGPSEIAGLQATLTGLSWVAPSNVPMTCFPQYIISLTENPTVNLTVSSTSASSAELNARGFLYCVDLSVTVTPILMNGSTYDISSASKVVAINDPDIGSIRPQVVIQQQPTGNVRVTWQSSKSAGRIVVIGRSSPGESNCMDVATVNGDGFTEYIVQLDCSYDDMSVTICVRYTTGGCSSMNATNTTNTVNIGDDVCPPSTTPTAAAAASIVGPVVGGVVGGVAAVAVVIIIIILILVLCKKKAGKGSGGDGMDSGKTKLTYHAAGATTATSGGVTSGGVTSVELSHVDSGAMYADPKAIEHQQTSTGDEYAMVSSNTKAKKKAPSRPPEAAVETGDLYSVPDKTKKIQNEGLVYADIDVANPQRPPPRSHGIQPQQIDNESVTYATVATV